MSKNFHGRPYREPEDGGVDDQFTLPVWQDHDGLQRFVDYLRLTRQEVGGVRFNPETALGYYALALGIDLKPGQGAPLGMGSKFDALLDRYYWLAPPEALDELTADIPSQPTAYVSA